MTLFSRTENLVAAITFVAVILAIVFSTEIPA